ncbi:LacI family DNA-binding transcriptional regulator [Aestuariibius sp. HNIBRBA575]|uniref:LacI family DNA-binding transcriptional regulator n=1 Tax=Aestuariibius sp. HNIBRBA575 TaxID=3233343 RepID=UPI0034A4536C
MSEHRNRADHKITTRRVTIADVSDALGLTKSTVSRALNGYPDIADATRLRVANMATKLGYRPLSHAQAIKTGRTRSLGLVVQTGDHDGASPFLADFLAGISFAASSEGWTLSVATSTDMQDTLEKIQELQRDRKADGFILPRTMLLDPRVDLLQATNTPFVLFGRTETSQDCAWYDILGERAMERAVVRLSAMGHRQIAFVNGGLDYTYAKLRREGYLHGLNVTGLDIDPDLIIENAVTPDAGRLATLSLLSRPSPPTAIVFSVDRAALGAYHAAQELGLTLGRDFSVIAYDGIPEGAYQTPPLSTYSVRHREAGERLGHMLIEIIRGNTSKNIPDTAQETALADFLDRGSAAPPALTSNELARKIRNHSDDQISNGRIPK